MIMLCFALKLDQFEEIEVSAEMHEAVQIQVLQGWSYIIECKCPFVLVFYNETTVMGKNDFELVLVHE